MNRLTPLEQRLVMELANGTWPTRAMLAAGYAKSTAYKKQWIVCRRPHIVRAVLRKRYELEGPEFLKFLPDEDLETLGIDLKRYHEGEIRKRKAEARRIAEATMARWIRRR